MSLISPVKLLGEC